MGYYAFEWLKGQFYEEEGDRVLWLPVFFIFGVFAGFAHCFDDAFVAIALALCVLAFSLTKNFLAIVLIFTFSGLLRANRHIAKYSYPTVGYNLGRVLVRGNIEEEIIKYSKDGELLKYIVLDVDGIEAIDRKSSFARDRSFKPPRKVRIKLLDGGEKIIFGRATVETSLTPIESKKFSSDFDLQTYFYFRKIGALGYRGVIKNVEERGAKNSSLGRRIGDLRLRMARRITSVRPGPATDMIAVVLTGQKNLAGANLMKLINYLGLNHILSISAMHMVIISSMILTAIRKIVFRFKKSAMRYNILKISACISLAVNSLYLIVGGFSVATVRAYIVNSINLAATLLDRFNSATRAVMLAALIVVFSRPDMVFRIGFHMSFLSSLAMTAFVDYYYVYRIVDDRDKFKKNPYGDIGMSLLISSVVEIAVAPLEAFSFNNFCPYRIILGSLVNPIVASIVIPTGLLSLVLYPLRLEGLLIYPLSFVVDALLWAIELFSHMPGAAMPVQSPSIPALFLCSMGVLWLSLWTGVWRMFGLVFYVSGLLSAFFGGTPDLLIDNGDGMVVFLDEKQRALLYKPKRRPAENLVRKLGKDSYRTLAKDGFDSCRGRSEKNCAKIRPGVNSILFQKNGKKLEIFKNKSRFYAKKISGGNMKIKYVDSRRTREPWFVKCASRGSPFRGGERRRTRK
jgi:competence protein ComEC